MTGLRQSLMGLFLTALTLALLSYAGAIVLGALQQRMEPVQRPLLTDEKVLTVDLVTVTSRRIVPELVVFGQLRAGRTVDLRVGSSGTVAEVDAAFVEGGVVAMGQVLLRLDPFDAQDALARIAADTLDAEAERRDAERALQLARDELAAAGVQAGLRVQSVERQRDLIARGAGAAQALETAQLASSAADQAILSRRQALAQAETRLDQTATALARLTIARAAAVRALADTVISAKFAGVLGEVTAAAGGRVAANERVAQLIDPTVLEVSFRVSTASYADLLGADGRLLRAKMAVEMEAAGKVIRATGQISREGAAVAEGQTGRLIFARLQTTAGLRPGDFVTVRVEEPALNGVVLLPATAVAADGTVLVVGPGDRLALAAVDVLRRQGDSVIVRAEGLEGQALVAVRSPQVGAGILVQRSVGG